MKFHVIHPGEMAELLSQKRAAVIDVRERDSYRAYHYPGAFCGPYEEMELWMRRFPKRRPVIVYCEYGSTSLLAARRMAQEGYEVYTVAGGIGAIRRYLGEEV